jgi:transcriptional regulator with XRE-family HTH domain
MKPKIVLKSEYLKELQEERGITDVALAKLAFLNPSQIWRVKERRSNPGPEFIAGILNAFPDKNFNDLFFILNPLQESQEGRISNFNLAKRDTDDLF